MSVDRRTESPRLAPSAADELSTIAAVPSLRADRRARPGALPGRTTLPGGAFDDVVGRACPLEPQLWHRRRLEDMQSRPDSAEAAAGRAAYHAAWLAHLDQPDDPRLLPLVSIVIPVFNAGDRVAEAVESGLAQTYPRVEVIVVDDGSTDGCQHVLAPWRGALRMIRQPNGGVASARNAGIRAARGELVHFLDADDVLHPESVIRKVAALASIPDAGLCFSDYHLAGSNAVKDSRRQSPPAIGDRHCPTRDLLDAVLHRFAVHASSAMLPRWLLVSSGGFDERLRISEDERYWFRLALAGVKAVAVDRRLTTRRLVPGSLCTDREAAAYSRARVAVMNLADLCAAARLWPLVPLYLRRCRRRGQWNTLCCGTHAGLPAVREKLLTAVLALPGVAARGSVSPLPLLGHLDRFAQRCGGRLDGRTPDELTGPLRRAISETLATALPVTPADAELWTATDIPADARRQNLTIVSDVFQRLGRGERTRRGLTRVRVWRGAARRGARGSRPQDSTATRESLP